MPKIDLGLPSYDSLFSTETERQEAKQEKIKENYIKTGVGVAENVAPTLFLCSKKIKMLVHFCSFFAQIKNSKNIAP